MRFCSVHYGQYYHVVIFFKVSSENDIFLNAELNIFVPNLLEGIQEYLFMDFHALMNNEIFYSYQPAYLRNCSGMLDETELREIDELAGLLQNPDENMEEIEKIWYDKNKFTILTKRLDRKSKIQKGA